MVVAEHLETMVLKSDATPYTFLLADDKDFMRRGLVNVIKLLGGKIVSFVDNRNDLLYFSQKTRPDIIFLDIMMNNVDTLDLVKELVWMKMATKIIITGSVSYEGLASKTIEYGADYFLLKPFGAYNAAIALKDVIVNNIN